MAIKDNFKKILEIDRKRHGPLIHIFKPKYSKLFLLILFSIFSYYLFSNPFIQNFFNSISGNTGYIYVFLFGCLFAFGFSTPIATGFFITYSPNSIFLTAIIGGVGALISDLLIFKFIKISFMDEFNALKKEKAFIRIQSLFQKSALFKIEKYLVFIFAGIIIASPLPDEVGVAMLAGFDRINIKTLGVLSFIFKVIGIYVLLLI